MEKIKRELGYGHKGNGLVVWDRLNLEFGDYQKIAHIRSDRSIKFFVEDLDSEYKSEIESVAKTNNSNVSTTQNTKIFLTPPVEDQKISVFTQPKLA